MESNNSPALMPMNEKRRSLLFYCTDNGTKLFVENGILVEERIQVSPPHPPKSSLFPNDKNWQPLIFGPGPYPPSPERYVIEDEAERISEATSAAEAALEYYNRKHQIKYVLVDPISRRANLCTGGIWYHCNFTAKPQVSSKTSNGGQSDSSTKLFFAELKNAGVKSCKKYAVTSCRPLHKPKATIQCEVCEGASDVLHPSGRYRQGRYQFKLRSLRPR